MSAPNPSPAATSAPTPERILQRLDWQVIRRLDGLLQGDYRTLFYGVGVDFADLREYQAEDDIRRLDGLLQGDYRTLFYGVGVDFADLREYQAEDDIRHIDWNVTARMNNPYVRQFVEDREITGWFLLDLSPSMAFGPVARPKDQVLTDFVTTLARLLTRNGNRVGAILFNNRLDKTIPPRTGRNQVLRLIQDLQKKTDPPPGTTTDLNYLLHAGLNTLKRRSVVFLISDFISEPGWEKPLALLNQRHELIAVRLWDPREVELPDAGMIVIEDSETGEQLYVDTSNPVFRRRFLEAAERREATLQASLNRAGVDLFSVSTEEDLVKSIVQMATLRKRRRRHGVRSQI